jgi:hypothetical protein
MRSALNTIITTDQQSYTALHRTGCACTCTYDKTLRTSMVVLVTSVALQHNHCVALDVHLCVQTARPYVTSMVVAANSSVALL